jgi:hypothetical protein
MADDDLIQLVDPLELEAIAACLPRLLVLGPSKRQLDAFVIRALTGGVEETGARAGNGGDPGCRS